MLQPVSSVRFIQPLRPQRGHQVVRDRFRFALTFIDLVIVVMIIGLTVSITLPRMADVQQKGRLRNAAMTLAEHLRLARTTAITRAVPVEFTFDPVLATYQCLQLKDPEQPSQTLSVDLRKSVSSDVQLNASFNSASSLVFGIDGLPRTLSGPVTTSTIRLSDGRAQEFVTLLHGWGTAQWQPAGPGSQGSSR